MGRCSLYGDEMFKIFQYLTLQIEPTNACNLDCQICMRRNLGRPTTFLSFDNFKKILNSGNFRYVGLHGWGEPLLNRQLFEMVRYAESKGVSTNLTTNGTLVRQNIDNILSSGLREIAFGIYDKDLFSHSLPQIEELTVERDKRHFKTPKTYLDITIYQGNLSQILNLIKLASEIRIDSVILHRLFNIYKVDSSAKCLSNVEENELFTQVKGLVKKLKLKLYVPPEHTFPCRIVNRSIFVTVEGEVTPCCYLPEFSLGNALEQGVERTMRSEAYTSFVKNMKNYSICNKCKW